MSKLYLVATPIGNLKDITLRALEVLRSADLILCEDTRVTGKLLKHYNIKKPLLSYQEHNELQRIPQIIKFLKDNKNIALVTDAGTPTLSDPGYKLVRECTKQKIKVEPVPGPSAILAGLTASGFPTDKFIFVGYPPHKPQKRRKFLSQLSTINYRPLSIVLFESPHRLLKTLQDMKEIFGDIEICVGRELTKLHEEIKREKISKFIEHFIRIKPKGEITIVFPITDNR